MEEGEHVQLLLQGRFYNGGAENTFVSANFTIISIPPAWPKLTFWTKRCQTRSGKHLRKPSTFA